MAQKTTLDLVFSKARQDLARRQARKFFNQASKCSSLEFQRLLTVGIFLGVGFWLVASALYLTDLFTENAILVQQNLALKPTLVTQNALNASQEPVHAAAMPQSTSQILNWLGALLIVMALFYWHRFAAQHPHFRIRRIR